jgi:hypothetical protein
MARKLLILACGSYTGDLALLSSSVPDAERLGALLGKRNVGDFAVKRLINPSLVDAQVAIHKILTEASATDLTLVYMSGHGLKDAYGRFYLALPETNLATLPASALSGRFIREQMADTSSGKLVVILDTCFAGAFSREMVAKSAAHATGLTEELTDERGHAVIAATSAIQYAFETAEIFPTSVFTRAMCDGIESGAADLDADGLISLGELFDYTAEKMREESKAQTPEVSYFGVNARIRIAKAPKSSRSAEIETEVNQALDSLHPELRLAAARILSQYAKDANRQRSSMARARLRSLRYDENADVRQVVGSSLGRTYRPRLTAVEFKARTVPIPGDEWASLDGRSLRLAGEQTPRFASFGNDYPVLATVALRLLGSSMEIVATDRYRLDWRRCDVLDCGKVPFEVLISANDFAALKDLPAESEVRITARDREVCFSVASSVLCARRELRYEFPKVDHIVAIAGNIFSLSRTTIIDGIESLICDRRMRLNEPIIMRASSSPRPMLTVSVNSRTNSNRSIPQVSIPASGPIPDFIIQLDYQRVLEALDAFEQDIIYMSAPHGHGPLLIMSAERDAKHRHAIMPAEWDED